MSRCPERSPPKTSCSASVACSASSGAGVFELAPAGALGEDLAAPDREMSWMRRLSAAIGRPVTFALTQNDHDPDAWFRMLELCAEARAEGASVRPQVAGRPVTLLLGLQTFHPFAYCPSWAEVGIVGHPPSKVATMARPGRASPLAVRGRRRDRADEAVPRPGARLPDERVPGLRAQSRHEHRGAGPRREPRADGRVLRRADGGRQAARSCSVRC